MQKIEQIKIAVSLQDGSLAVLSIVLDDGRTVKVKPTKENIEKEIMRQPFGPSMVSWRIIQDEDLPQDRTFRGAWQDKNKKIGHDMEKVEKLHTDRLRNERTAILQEKDKDWMKAFGQGNLVEAQQIEEQRQKLRDFPELLKDKFKKAKTIDDIKNITLHNL